jgi:hypothetical protein
MASRRPAVGWGAGLQQPFLPPGGLQEPFLRAFSSCATKSRGEPCEGDRVPGAVSMPKRFLARMAVARASVVLVAAAQRLKTIGVNRLQRLRDDLAGDESPCIEGAFLLALRRSREDWGHTRFFWGHGCRVTGVRRVPRTGFVHRSRPGAIRLDCLPLWIGRGETPNHRGVDRR